MRMLPLGVLVLASARLLTAAAQPAAVEGPRTTHAVGYYDPGMRRVVLVGEAGDPKDGLRDRVWSWSGARWEPVTDAGPPGRTNGTAGFDPVRGRAVVSGGARKSADDRWQVVGDNWAGGAGGWQRIGEIAPRDHHALVEEPGGRLLMFGGIPAERSSAWPNDTWVLDGDAWKRIATDGPPGRGRTALAYDRKRKQVVLFGGASATTGPGQAQTFYGDTWTWDGVRWRKAADGGPRGRYAHAMVFDERAGVVLLYTGAAAHRDAPLADMWQWDGERWTEIPLTGPTPGYRYQPVMVYDRARERTVLYGGSGAPSDTWEWDGRHWRQVSS